jgi:hypothetical protein
MSLKLPEPEMDIYTVRDNLIKTIEGKVAYLEEVQKARESATGGADSALFATQEFLKINIVELNKILKDVAECCTKAPEDSWLRNPDRSGGQFTPDEIGNADRWV